MWEGWEGQKGVAINGYIKVQRPNSVHTDIEKEAGLGKNLESQSLL